MKPVVDRLEQEMGDGLEIIRINLQSEAGHELAAAYNFEATPTFIYFDSQGNELWRQVGGLDVDHVRQSVQQP
jgi:thioredoxin-related protein